MVGVLSSGPEGPTGLLLPEPTGRAEKQAPVSESWYFITKTFAPKDSDPG